MRREFIVSLKMPEGVSVREMTGYIESAVSIWKGSMSPEDAIFFLEGDSVRVRCAPIKRKKTK